VKYAYIREHAEVWPVRLLARLLYIHPSGYYAWLRQPETLHGAEEHRLCGRVRELWQESGGEYGYRQIFEMLRDTGEVCSLGRARALLRSVKAGAQSGICERLSPTEASVIPTAQNIQPPLPNLRWVVGVSAIPTEEGSVNLGIIIDTFSGRIIRWGLHDSDVRKLPLCLLQGLLNGRQVQQKLLIHFDSATRYTHKEWHHALRFIDPERKISRRGPCSSHQHVASFFHWLQTEKIGEATPATAKELQNQLFNFINEFNSLQRSESTLNPLLYRISDLTYGGFDGVL